MVASGLAHVGKSSAAVGVDDEHAALLPSVAHRPALYMARLQGTGGVCEGPDLHRPKAVLEARRTQYRRWRGKPNCNARMQPRDLQKHCVLDDPTRDLLRAAMEELDLSARAYDRILKVSRTLADLARTENIQAEHVSEAIQYRSLDRQIWT